MKNHEIAEKLSKKSNKMKFLSKKVFASSTFRNFREDKKNFRILDKPLSFLCAA